MNDAYAKLKECLAYIRSKTDFTPEIGLVLGSGLGKFADEIKVEFTVNYSTIPRFPLSTVSGHKGRFVFGYIGDKKVVIMQGRVHYYEGYDISDVVLPIRLMGLLGIRVLILTNAAGGINSEFAPGELMMIRDHIASFVPSPLRGKNIDELGPRFPDMSQVYSKELLLLLKKSAAETDITIKSGVYLQTGGPQYETPAEISAYRTLGADAVGMSTACESIAAKHMGIDVCGISCITNMAAGISESALSHDEVKATATKTADSFSKLLKAFIGNIPTEVKSNG